MLSLDPKYLSALRFNNVEVSTLNIIGEYRGKQLLYSQQTPELLQSLKNLAIVESSESSNRIEGITAPYNRIEAIVLENTNPQNRSEQEIAGYRDALALIHDSAEHMQLTANLILQMHTILYRYHTGRGGHWKMTDNEIVEKNPDGSIRRVRFTPTPAISTPYHMEMLIKQFHDAVNQQTVDALIIVPLIILDFLCIHPFTDGNGRISRLLTLILLHQFGYIVGRYISLERIFEESKESYYEALEASSKNWSSQEHDAHPWLNYFWGVLLRGYREFEERVGTVKKGKGFKTEQIKLAVQNKIGEFTITDIEKACPGVGRDMVRYILRRLRDEGFIKSTKVGRNAKWVKIDK